MQTQQTTTCGGCGGDNAHFVATEMIPCVSCDLCPTVCWS